MIINIILEARDIFDTQQNNTYQSMLRDVLKTVKKYLYLLSETRHARRLLEEQRTQPLSLTPPLQLNLHTNVLRN